MRTQTDPWFSKYLLRIGNGTEETISHDYVRLPDDILIGYTPGDAPVMKLIEHVFPSLHENASSSAYMSTCVILSTKNEHVDDLKEMAAQYEKSEASNTSTAGALKVDYI